MQQFYEYDSRGYYLGPVVAALCPANCTATPRPVPCWRPRWNGFEWIEEAPKPDDGKYYERNGEEWIEVPNPLRAAKLAEISAACKAAIYAGIEIDGERFSLTTEDQINIQNLALQIQGGAESVLYHADGGLCEPFPAAKMLALTEAAVRHVTYHTTLCNVYNFWIRRADDNEISNISYGVPLPNDLAEHMHNLLKE